MLQLSGNSVATCVREWGGRRACRLAKVARGLPSIGSGMVVAVPIPAEDEALGRELQGHIDAALREAEEQGVSGAGITPFLLGRVAELTGGRSLDANIRLVINNAKVGTRIAVAVAEQQRQERSKL